MTVKGVALEPTDTLYIQPLSPCYNGVGGLLLGGGPLQFLHARLIIVRDGERIIDTRLPIAELLALKADLPATLKTRLETLIKNLETPRAPCVLTGLGRALQYSKPLIMGVLNVTPDSFSDGGKFVDKDKAITHARALFAAGADIIDIGGESTRPGAEPVWEGDERARVIPVVEALVGEGIPISIDTRHASVMEAALSAGAHIINDVSALSFDPEAMAVVAKSDVPVVLMHSKGLPKTMQDAPDYDDVLLEVFDYLEERRDMAIKAGIAPTRIILDPGIGFGKRVVQDNLSILNGISIFHTLGCPLLLGASRKQFLGAITGVEEPSKRVESSMVAALSAVQVGVQIVRVHDVGETKQALKTQQALNDFSIMDIFDR